MDYISDKIVSCPNCSRKLRIPSNKGLLKVRCKICNTTFYQNSDNEVKEQPHIKSFQEAYFYIKSTSEKDIFTRAVTYQVWAEYVRKPFPEVWFTILISALGGAFNFSFSDDIAMKELLEITEYGKNKLTISNWCNKYCRSDADWNYFLDMMDIIKQKENKVADYMDANARDPKPQEYYLPEISTVGHLIRSWPRI